MIKNERQYRITKAQAARFVETLERLGQGSGGTAGVHPRIVQAQADAIRSQLEDLEREIARVRDIEGRRIQARKAECGGRVGDGIDQGADRAGAESKGPGGADWSQGAADPALRGDRLRSCEPCSNQRGGECVGGEGLTRLLRAGGRLLEERGESVGLDYCGDIIGMRLSAEIPTVHGLGGAGRSYLGSENRVFGD